MPQTLLDIANSALVKVGSPLISSLLLATKPAELANARIRPVRNMILRNHVWAFARSYASPTPAASTIDRWSYAYTLPALCLRILSVTSGEDGSRINEYEIIGRVIYCNADNLFLRFIEEPDPADEATETYPDDFAEAVASYLASELSIPLFDSPERRKQWIEQYGMNLRYARFNGAVEQPLSAINQSEWIDSRLVPSNDRSLFDLDAPVGGV